MLIVTISVTLLCKHLFSFTSLSITMNRLITLMITFVIDIIIYVGLNLLMKEDLVYSFIRKTPKEI